MPTKQSIIQDALANTANNLATEEDFDAAPDEGGFEWERARRAYERELPLLLERHPWPFARATEALEQEADDDNPSNRYAKAYAWPPAALWLERVEMPGGGALGYDIIGRYLCMDYDGTGADAPVATFVQVPPTTAISNLFWEVLRLKVEAGCLRAINEDYAEAKRRDDSAELLLAGQARVRVDQQRPARRAFRSSMLERRRGGGGPRAC